MSRDTTIDNTIHNSGKHKAWLHNEYSEWVKALQESTVHNFKEHPQVRRMLSLDLDTRLFDDCIWRLTTDQKHSLNGIEDIGYTNPNGVKRDHFRRIIFYALEILKLNPSSICEIGGGVGQFFATLRALGYKGDYWIRDIDAIYVFQQKYLSEVSRQTRLDLTLDYDTRIDYEMVVSFYALGEFDDQTKLKYKTTIDGADHGYIAWNVHSGATDDKTIFSAHNIQITPGVEPGIEIITW